MEFFGRILDNVHGFIDVTECEQQIIELPIFKRLQHIKQLSLVNWIFPGSEHTRYIHSLGVMHIADQMATHLGYDEEHRVLIRLAGLLHDLGHYPLSHEGETAYMEDYYASKDYYEFNSEQINDKINKLDRKPSLTRMEVAKPYHHEQITVSVIRNSKTIQDIIKHFYGHYPLVTIENICFIITGNTNKKELSGLVQLMHSELDADRIDYLMRDANFSGTCYGAFELGYILRNLERKDYKGYEIIGLNPKGIALADQFLMNRFFSYHQVVFNKHVAILGMMVSTLIKEYRQGKGLLDRNSLNNHIAAHERTDFYNRFTDVSFWNLLHSTKGNDYSDVFHENVANKLLNNSELGSVVKEKVIIGEGGASLKQAIIASDVYADFTNKVKDKIFLFHDLSFTKQIPFKDYVELMHQEKFSDALWDVKLYQESIVVIDGDEMKLLVDCPESIMSQMYSKRFVIFREYEVA